MKRLTVIQTLPALESGGVERGTLEIGRALVAAGHRSIVISNGGRLVRQLEAEGSEHIKMPVHRKSLASLWQVGPFRQQLMTIQPDILHARSRVPAWIAWLAWRKLPENQRPHFVTTVHGLYSVNFYSAIMTRGEKVIAVSNTVKDYILHNYPSCPAERIQVIHRGVSPDEFPHGFQPSADWLQHWQHDYPQLTGKRVLTLAGRITRWKGQLEFVDLIGQLVAEGLPVHGVIAGGAEVKKQAFLEELQTKIRQQQLSDFITLTGHRADLREIYSQSDLVYSLSSDPEAFGRTTLEALSIGAPVIGWDHGGVSETLAACYPQGAVPFNDKAALLAKTKALLAQPQPPAIVNTFFQSTMCERTLAIYQQLAGA